MIVVVLSQPERLIIAGREQQNSVRSTRKRPQRVRLYRGRGVHRKRYRGLSMNSGCLETPTARIPPGLSRLRGRPHRSIEIKSSEAWPSFRSAEPNPTHHAVVELERADRLAAVVTQNIDGLHSRAWNVAGLVELHGTNRWKSELRAAN